MYGGKNQGYTCPNVSKRSGGYTILEVLIFLAVSGVMFVIAASFINGKQAATQFRQGVQDTASQIDTIISNVSNGYYPNQKNFICTATPGLSTPPVIVGAVIGNNQGTNLGCVFLGKMLQFNVAGTNGMQYSTISVAGRQLDASNQPATTLDKAQPVAVDQGNVTETTTLAYGLSVMGMKVDGASDDYGIGFFGSLGSKDLTGSLQSGSQTVGLTKYLGGLGSVSTSQAESQIRSSVLAPTVSSIGDASSAIICLTDGSRRANITIGDSGNQLGTDVQYLSDNVPC